MKGIDNCDRCGKLVEPQDSALRLDVFMGYASAFALVMAQDRHIECSPSRMKGLKERPEYAFGLVRYRDSLEEEPERG